MARPMAREERINYELNFNVDRYGSGDVRSSRMYCEAYVDGMIAVEQIQEKFKNNNSEYVRGYRDGASLDKNNPSTIIFMGYTLEYLCKIIQKHEERKAKAIVIDHIDKSPIIVKRNGNVILDETE